MTKDSDPLETKVWFTTSDEPLTLSGLQKESKIGLLLPGHSYGQEVEDKEASSTRNSRNLLLCQFGSGAASIPLTSLVQHTSILGLTVLCFPVNLHKILISFTQAKTHLSTFFLNT